MNIKVIERNRLIATITITGIRTAMNTIKVMITMAQNRMNTRTSTPMRTGIHTTTRTRTGTQTNISTVTRKSIVATNMATRTSMVATITITGILMAIKPIFTIPRMPRNSTGVRPCRGSALRSPKR